jgi:putative transposase
MRQSRFTDSQILGILKQNEQGTSVADLCREHGMSSGLFYRWRAKFTGADTDMIKRIRDLEEENERLKKMYAEERVKAEIREEKLQKKLQG